MTKLKWVFISVLFLPIASIFPQGTAPAVLRSHSFGLPSATLFIPGQGVFEYFYTSPDGGTGFPLHDQDGNTLRFSGEARPRTGVGGVYDTDYVIYPQGSSNPVEYGTLALTIPIVDSNANGVADFLELDSVVNLTFSVVATADWPSVSVDTYGGTLTRGAGQIVGTISISPPSGSFTLVGNWGIGHASGSVSYLRGAMSTISFDLATLRNGMVPFSYSGSTTFVVASADEIQAAPTQFTSTNGLVFRSSQPTILRRSSNRLIGPWLYDDGNASSSWADFRNWQLEISDPNDYNLNGIPDLSDSPPQPAAQIQKAAAAPTLFITSAPTFRYVIESSVNLKQWSTYRTFASPTGRFEESLQLSPYRFFRVRSE